MSQILIQAENLGKKYTLAHARAGGDGLRHALQEMAARPYRWVRNFASRSNQASAGRNDFKSREEFWALKDVNLEVHRGDVVGVVGRNGAGKSTLLKILSRITEPTTGCVRLRGRVASLLEVGTGFHPELTGRENIFLNGAILGMSFVEIKRKFDEILAFAEVEKFLDTPVKRYSSGMYVRLAFAVAAHLESEIMLVDEVLAVGDAQFQKKCLGKMHEVAASEGRTILFVSHNTGVVASLCNKGVLMRQGRVITTGAIRDVLRHYTADASKDSVEFQPEQARAAITRIVIDQERLGDGDLVVEVSFSSPSPLNPAIVGIVVSTTMGVPVFATDPLMHPDDYAAANVCEGTARVEVPDLCLHPGEYRMSVFLAEMGAPLDYRRDVLSFDFVPRRPIAAKCPPIEIIGPMIVNARWEMFAGKASAEPMVAIHESCAG